MLKMPIPVFQIGLGRTQPVCERDGTHYATLCSRKNTTPISHPPCVYVLVGTSTWGTSKSISSTWSGLVDGMPCSPNGTAAFRDPRYPSPPLPARTACQHRLHSVRATAVAHADNSAPDDGRRHASRPQAASSSAPIRTARAQARRGSPRS